MKGFFENTEITPDNQEEYYSEGEYYTEEEYDTEAEYYEEEGYEAEGEYYEEDEYYAEEEYYAEDGEYYAEEEYYAEDGEYYAEEEYYAEDEYYGEEEYYTEDGYYEDEQYYTEEYYTEGEYYEDEIYYAGGVSKQSFPEKVKEIFLNMAAMDRAITVTGVVVLIIALITGTLYIGKAADKQAVSALATVGSGLDGIDMIGKEGLLAVADAQKARLAAAEMLQQQEENVEYVENEYSDVVTVKLNMTSVKKDLKLKFTNEKTGKLISNVPFTVTVTDPAGKSNTWSDDDKDGIIYKKNITPGDYKILMNELIGEDYGNFIISTVVQTVEVKKDIEYEKIDVSDEVKTEDEIDVSKEDTVIKETEEEPVLQDTVEWVESTVIEETYTEVPKSSVSDPATLAMTAGVKRMAKNVSGGDAKPQLEISLNKTKVTLSPEKSVKVKATVKPEGKGTVSAESSDESVATVAVKGKTITVTGVGEGQATVTVTFAKGSQAVQATCEVEVNASPENDKETKLKDTSGAQLYVWEDEKYREAVYADYYTFDKFFVKGEPKYTGWQTIDGKVYFYTAEGEKVTGEQVIRGAKYNFASDGSLVTDSGVMGIDVSKWNGTIDWKAVKNSGVSYVIIRCGYRGSTQGVLVEDPTFNTNIKGATEVGLKVGVYFFSQAIDEIEAVEEASYVLDKIKGYKISYPVFLDVEPSGGRADGIDKATRTAVCKAFCETIQRAGYTAGIYANKTWLEEKIDVAQLSAYKIWLAQYAATPTYRGRYDMWQYSSKGKVNGINGDVDLNTSYLGY